MICLDLSTFFSSIVIMPRGKKQCPNCNSLQAARALSCSDCNHTFSLKKTKVKTPKPFFKERKDFIKRMLNGSKSQDMKLDMMVATSIFKTFDNDLDFLSKVKPPFKFEGSIKYFFSKDGREYLRKKKLEFEYNPENTEKIIDHLDKVGEDMKISTKKTLRNFLDDE